jgi:hypothetical protein
VDAVLSPNSSDVSSRLAYSQLDVGVGLGFGSGSQPAHHISHNNESADLIDHPGPAAVFSFSQPAHIDDMLLNSQLGNTQTAIDGSGGSSPLQRLVKRMTRLVAKVSCDEAVKYLGQHLTKMGYTWKIHSPGVVR